MAAKQFGAHAEIPRLEGAVMTLVLFSRTAVMMSPSWPLGDSVATACTWTS